MPFPDIDPVFLRIGPLAFRWYGLMYIIAFIAGYFLVSRRVKERGLPLDRDDVADLVFCLALGVILGGRLGYILFYNFSYYLANPLKLFAVWEGGMSFHGGAIGIVVAGAFYVRKKKVPFLKLADVAVQAGPIGLGLGRVGNFINGELYGRATSVPWGVVFPGGGAQPRHPSQLYEALLEGPLLFLLLRFVWKLRLPDGAVFWSFIAAYGLVRFCIEFFREPDMQLGFVAGALTMGQLLSLPMLLGGAAMLFVTARRR
jgi:phosphatidylglycerol---prolipoprotein diacylglyceryl transferase